MSRPTPNLTTRRYFIQQDERNLEDLFDCQSGFETLEEAHEWIASDDPEKKYAYDIYLVDIRKVDFV